LILVLKLNRHHLSIAIYISPEIRWWNFLLETGSHPLSWLPRKTRTTFQCLIKIFCYFFSIYIFIFTFQDYIESSKLDAVNGKILESLSLFLVTCLLCDPCNSYIIGGYFYIIQIYITFSYSLMLHFLRMLLIFFIFYFNLNFIVSETCHINGFYQLF